MPDVTVLRGGETPELYEASQNEKAEMIKCFEIMLDAQSEETDCKISQKREERALCEGPKVEKYSS